MTYNIVVSYVSVCLFSYLFTNAAYYRHVYLSLHSCTWLCPKKVFEYSFAPSNELLCPLYAIEISMLLSPYTYPPNHQEDQYGSSQGECLALAAAAAAAPPPPWATADDDDDDGEVGQDSLGSKGMISTWGCCKRKNSRVRLAFGPRIHPLPLPLERISSFWRASHPSSPSVSNTAGGGWSNDGDGRAGRGGDEGLLLVMIDFDDKDGFFFCFFSWGLCTPKGGVR